jgi:cell wall-associated NlpC family hydrolase
MYSAVAKDNVVSVQYYGLKERYIFATPEEASSRAAIATEGYSWVGTPFVNCADIKGKNGGVDCAMLLVRSYVDTNVLAPFDPRPYDPQWYLHNDEPKFLNWIEVELHGREVASPQLGDVAVFFYGRCFSHGAIYLGVNQIVHAQAKGRCVYVTTLDDTGLRVTKGGLKRPVKFYEVRRG